MRKLNSIDLSTYNSLYHKYILYVLNLKNGSLLQNSICWNKAAKMSHFPPYFLHIVILFAYAIDPSLSHARKPPQANRGLATVTRRGRSGKLSSEGNMPKRCAYGLCKSDTRYPKSLDGVVEFFPFPKPKTQGEKCRAWIKQCGRPHSQLNVDKNTYVCSKVRTR